LTAACVKKQPALGTWKIVWRNTSLRPSSLDIYKAVGLKDASSHSGRRTYITRLANKGVGVRLLAALAGHSHISTTQRYIDVNAEQLSAAVELL
jgi:site-specific recombinase XerD